MIRWLECTLCLTNGSRTLSYVMSRGICIRSGPSFAAFGDTSSRTCKPVQREEFVKCFAHGGSVPTLRRVSVSGDPLLGETSPRKSISVYFGGNDYWLFFSNWNEAAPIGVRGKVHLGRAENGGSVPGGLFQCCNRAFQLAHCDAAHTYPCANADNGTTVPSKVCEELVRAIRHGVELPSSLGAVIKSGNGR